jgi:Fur family transcriptional regulator, ferric uptake regulator
MILSINKTHSDEPVLTRLVAHLAASGCRITAPRRAVLRQMVGCRSAFTATDLLDRVLDASPDVGRATVFRTLDLLLDHGLLRRVHTDTGASWGHSYVLCGLSDTHHHHLVCTRCGAITDFEACTVGSLVADLEAKTNFKVEGHHLELYGECESCRRATR